MSAEEDLPEEIVTPPLEVIVTNPKKKETTPYDSTDIDDYEEVLTEEEKNI